MKAAVYYQSGAPGVIRYEDVPGPQCAADEILIRVEAISIEGGDLLYRQMTPPPTQPFIVGYSAAGEIIDLGSDVDDFAIGQKVITFGFDGSHAELRASKAIHCWPLPKGLSAETAAGIPSAFGTAHDCLFEAGQLQQGQTVLIQGAAGGVGLAAVQLARQAGATVLGTAGTDQRLEQLHQYGLDKGINYSSCDLAAEIRRLTDGRGVDLVLDPVGGWALDAAVKATAQGGRVIVIGCAAREANTIDAMDILQSCLTVVGMHYGFYIGSVRTDAIIRDLISQVERGELEMVIDRCFSLADAATAHAYAESRNRGLGRVVMIP